MIFLHLLSQCLLLTVWPVSEMIWYSLCTSIKGEKYLWRVGIYGIYKKACPIPSTKFASVTVVPNWESTKPSLCSKFPLFKTSWWMLRVLPQLSPLESSLPYLRSKLKVLLLLSELRSFVFDLLYFWSSIRYRVIQYLIGKLSDMVKMIQEG